MSVVKDRRNVLAHGEETFSQCGRDYTLEQIKETMTESFDFMYFILKHLAEFVDQKKNKN